MYQYDAAGRVTREDKTVLGLLYTTSYAYDNVGNLTQMTYPSGRAVTSGYDALSRPLSVSAPVGGTPVALVSGIAYDNVGNLLTLPLSNGLSETRTFDAANRVVAITVPGVLEQSFGYDNVGNIVAWGDAVTSAIPPGLGTATYAYAGNRLDNVTEGGFFSPYAYDNTGHPTIDGIKEFVYNQNRRLFQVKAGASVLGEYTYDGKGRRVIKSASGVTTVFHYDVSGRLIAETDAAGNLLVDYIYLEGKPLAMVRMTGSTEAAYYYHNDHLGMPKTMTDSSRTVVWRVPFDAFGNELAGGIKTVENNLRFPGQYFDAESGLHYNYFRDYDPKTGRYIEPDPVGIVGGMNLYAYVDANPLRIVDKTGLWGTGGDSNPNASTIVCDGNGGVSAQVEPIGDPLTKRCISDCIFRHELSHANDALRSNPNICKGKKAGEQIIYSDRKEQSASEIKANNVEIDCLKEKLKCPSDCDPVIKRRIKVVEDYRDGF